MVYKFFDKKTSGGANRNGIKQNEKLAEELDKVVTQNSGKRRKLHSSIIDNIWWLIYLICNY